MITSKQTKIYFSQDQDQDLQDIQEKIMSTMPSSDQTEVTTEEMLAKVSTVTPTPEPLPTPLPVLIDIGQCQLVDF